MDNAREAVLEGQAQAMMFQYAIAPTGHSITTSPELVGAMEEESLTGTPSTKVFNDAPIFLKESMTFPYSYGMDFVIKVLQKGGKNTAFAGILANPPHTTRQIMQPETYLAGEKIEPMTVADFKHDFKDYQKFDIGAMGEFDVAVLIEQYAGKKISKTDVSGVARRILLRGEVKDESFRSACPVLRFPLVEPDHSRPVCRDLRPFVKPSLQEGDRGRRSERGGAEDAGQQRQRPTAARRPP